MKNFIFTLFLVVFISFNSNAQYKYDVGLKVSSFELEGFQFDGRYHFKSAYSILVSATHGSQTISDQSRIPISDSLISYSSTYVNKKHVSVKAGIQRKLEFLASDVFYVGASLGVGYQRNFGYLNSGSYVIDSTVNHQNYITEISTSETNSSERTIKSQIDLTFGFDIPLTKRLCINGEIGLSSYYQTSLNYQNSFFSQHVYVSGGLRYSFGKTES